MILTCKIRNALKNKKKVWQWKIGNIIVRRYMPMLQELAHILEFDLPTNY